MRGIHLPNDRVYYIPPLPILARNITNVGDIKKVIPLVR